MVGFCRGGSLFSIFSTVRAAQDPGCFPWHFGTADNNIIFNIGFFQCPLRRVVVDFLGILAKFIAYIEISKYSFCQCMLRRALSVFLGIKAQVMYNQR